MNGCCSLDCKHEALRWSNGANEVEWLLRLMLRSGELSNLTLRSSGSPPRTVPVFFPKTGLQATYLRITEGSADSWVPPHLRPIGSPEGGTGGLYIFWAPQVTLKHTKVWYNSAKDETQALILVPSIPKGIACWLLARAVLGEQERQAAWLVLRAHHEE